MEPAECLKRLQLGDAATLAQIKQAYRQLAQQYHPDKCGGDETGLRLFMEVGEAYRTLARAARGIASGRTIGVCRDCREWGEVAVRPDGVARCPRCALRGPRRFLPLPTIVVVRCLTTILLIAVAVVLLVKAIATLQFAYAAGAMAAGLLSLVMLALTCLRVLYCLQPRGRPREERERKPRTLPAPRAN